MDGTNQLTKSFSDHRTWNYDMFLDVHKKQIYTMKGGTLYRADYQLEGLEAITAQMDTPVTAWCLWNGAIVGKSEELIWKSSLSQKTEPM